MGEWTVAVLGEEQKTNYDATLPAVADSCACEQALYTIDGTTLSWVMVSVILQQAVGIGGDLSDLTLPAIAQMLGEDDAPSGGGEFPMIRRPFPTNIIAYG